MSHSATQPLKHEPEAMSDGPKAKRHGPLQHWVLATWIKSFPYWLLAIGYWLIPCTSHAQTFDPVPVQSTLEKGFSPRWLLCGPFPPGVQGGMMGMLLSQKVHITDTDFLTEHGGEMKIEPQPGMTHTSAVAKKKQAVWTTVETPGPLMDLDMISKAMEGTVYAATYIESPEDMPIFLEAQSFTGLRIWLNHELLRASPQGELGRTGLEKLALPLKKGKNLIILKFAGIRLERAAKAVGVSLEAVRSYVGIISATMAQGSGLNGAAFFYPLYSVGKTGLNVIGSLKPTNFLRGTVQNPGQEFEVSLYNSTNKTVSGAQVSIQSDILKVKETKDVSEISGFQGRVVRFVVPAPKEQRGKKVEVRVTILADGETLAVPVKVAISENFPPKEEVIYYVPGFHADPVWIEDERDYSVALMGSTWQNLQIMRKDPGYGVFLSEIPYLKPYYDSYFFDREYLLEMIKAGRVGTGGSYNQGVEKLVGPEGLVRNILYGKLFHGKVLGDHPQSYMGWDIFGHVAQLSQMLAKSDHLGAVWSKMVWGFHPIFWHMSLDGTKLLHKRGSYSSNSTSQDDLRGINYEKFRELRKYGLRYDLRLDAGDFKPPTAWFAGESSEFLTFMPRIMVTGQGADKFFESVLAQYKNKEPVDIPLTTRDMSYYHEGTALSRIEFKIGNRLAENAIQNAEKFGTIANLLGAKYPDEALDKAWRQLLFGQHHDALTGTINDRSFLDLIAAYREALELSTDALNNALDYIGEAIDTRSVTSGAAVKPHIPIAVFNPMNWYRKDVVKAWVDFSSVGGSVWEKFKIQEAMEGNNVPFEVLETDGARAKILFVAQGVPSMGYKMFYVFPDSTAPEKPKAASGAAIENEFYKITVDPRKGGGIASLFDKKANKELMPDGEVGNDIAALVENPNRNEPPWEVFTTGTKLFSKDFPAEVDILEGPVSTRLRIKGKAKDSGKYQEIILYKDIQRIDFLTGIINYTGKDDMFVVTFPTKLQNSVPVFEERFGVSVKRKSKGKLVFQSQAPGNPSGMGARSAYQWMDLSHSGLIQFMDDKGEISASEPFGMVGIVMPKDNAVVSSANALMETLIKSGIHCTPWFDDGDPGRLGDLADPDHSFPQDMNQDLSYGTSFRIALGGPEQNRYTKKLFDKLDEKAKQVYEKWMNKNGFAYLLVMDKDVPEGWQPVPVLIVGGNIKTAVQGVADEFLRNRVFTMYEDMNATGAKNKVENYGMALLNLGTPFNSVENDATMVMALFHTASFFHRLPYNIIPEDKTHFFPYALIPHEGTWREANIVQAGFDFNNPLMAKQLPVHGGFLPSDELSFLGFSPNNVVVTTMKPKGNPTASMEVNNINVAKDGIILRFYETHGEPTKEQVTFFTGVSKVWNSNLLEDNGKGLSTTLSVSPFSIETIGFLPKPPAKTLPTKTIGMEREISQPVYERFWLHNRGEAALQYQPVGIYLKGDIKTGIHISQGGVTVNEIEVGIVNDYLKERISGTARILTPSDWKAIPDTISYDILPGKHQTAKILIAFLSGNRKGLIKAKMTHRGQTYQDVLEVGELPLEMSAEKSGNELLVTLKNPNIQTIEGEVQLVTPIETWGEKLVGDYSFMEISPLEQNFSLQPGETKVLRFSITPPKPSHAWMSSYWVDIKLMYNGRLEYKELSFAGN